MSASFPSGRRWAELSPRTRAAVMALGTVQVALGLAAQIDITRRPSGQIRGAPWRWRAGEPDQRGRALDVLQVRPTWPDAPLT